jgi:ribose transport system substrate-binding protein
MSINVAAGVRQAGKAGKAPIASYNGTPAVIKMIQDDDLVMADAGESLSWIAYGTMDQALRLLTGMDPLPDEDNNTQLPLRIFDDSNAAEAGSPPDAAKGYGDAHVAGYEKLWGLQ